MSAFVRAFLERHAPRGGLEEEVLLRAQRELSEEQLLELRRSPEVARSCFGVEHLERIEADYAFWDTTTLSLKRPLLAEVTDGLSVLELGPGPAATLSLWLAGVRSGLRQVCAERDTRFAASAREAVRLNGRAIEVLDSDLAAAVRERFDLVFMNPPYVPRAQLEARGLGPGSPAARAGDGGVDGLELVRRFAAEVPALLRPGGRALCGVNLRYLPAAEVLRALEGSSLPVRALVPAAEVAPVGLRSQVFRLG